MAFRVGQKVVCVDANSNDPRCGPGWRADPLRNGAIYTIAGFGTSKFGETCLLLEEAKNTAMHQYGYHPRRFRPLTERSTEAGMAILRSYLVTANGKVEA
jgi:hypothetical protein